MCIAEDIQNVRLKGDWQMNNQLLSLRNTIEQLMREYNSVYDHVRTNNDWKNSFRNIISSEIPVLLQQCAKIQDPYKIVGSYGKGRWTAVPWIAIFDSRITTSAQEGVYIVYLLNKDAHELYLTFEIAATEAMGVRKNAEGNTVFTGVVGANDPQLTAKLQLRANEIRGAVKSSYFSQDTAINSGATGYDSGAVYYKKYTLDNLPSGQELIDDLQKMMEIYKNYYEWSQSSDNAWWPSQNEYDSGISMEKWLALLNTPDILGDNIRRMLAGMYTQGGSATCAQLAELYGKTASHYVMTAVHAAENVVKATNCPILQDKEDSKYWPVFFVGRNEPKTDRFIWRIRDELYAALAEYGIEKYLPQGVVAGKFDSWEIVDENTAVKHCDKSFFEYRGSGVPKGICWFFNADAMELGENKVIKLVYNGVQYQGSVKNESSDHRRVRIFWSTELGSLFDSFNAPDATATFKRIADDIYEVSIKGGEKEMTIKEKVEAIKSYIATRGFNYEGDLIENFYLSLKSKPFVILAGTSGTGKTRLVKLFAEAIGAKMQLVPVRPDWSDSSDLFGHNDLSGKFHPGAIIDFIKQAEWDKSTPHFLCLDEMNLARVEYYLSDFLSIIETRDRNENGIIETDALVDASYFQAKEAREKYGRVYLPENLYIIGTVNMDETTFPFSKKVLDRANTIEFSFVNLMAKATAGGKAVAQKLDNSFLKTEYLYLHDCDDEELIDNICFDLEELNHILVKANLHVGYRVRDEISFYMMNNKKADLLTQEAAFDHEIMQKILPRVQGSSAAIKDVLSELFIKCAGDYTGFAGAAAYEQMNAYLDSKSCRYPNSTKKIAFMMRRYEEDGFTSYWL